MKQMQLEIFPGSEVVMSAVLSECGRYRYRLSRTWDASLPVVAFIGLNPSTADHRVDDPTTRICVNYAKRWGYGAMLLGNLFSYRSRDPDKLYAVQDPVGPEGDYHLGRIVGEADLVVCCWSARGRMSGRDEVVYRRIKNPRCLSVLNDGSPGHPLYKSSLLKPMTYLR